MQYLPRRATLFINSCADLLLFQVDDFDSAVESARSLRTEIIEEPHVNPGPQHREMWLRDPDGYVVVIAGPDGESAS
jgi:hypothetical protein